VEFQFSPNLIQGDIIIIIIIYFIFFGHFQHSLSARKGFTSTLIQHLWNVLHATLLTVVVVTTTSATEKHPKKKLNQLCSQLSTMKTVLLLTLPLSVLLYFQYSSALLSI